MPDGTTQAPGGWNRFAIEVADLEAIVNQLRAAAVHLRNDIATEVGGKQSRRCQKRNSATSSRSHRWSPQIRPSSQRNRQAPPS